MKIILMYLIQLNLKMFQLKVTILIKNRNNNKIHNKYQEVLLRIAKIKKLNLMITINYLQKLIIILQFLQKYHLLYQKIMAKFVNKQKILIK